LPSRSDESRPSARAEHGWVASRNARSPELQDRVDEFLEQPTSACPESTFRGSHSARFGCDGVLVLSLAFTKAGASQTSRRVSSYGGRARRLDRCIVLNVADAARARSSRSPRPRRELTWSRPAGHRPHRRVEGGARRSAVLRRLWMAPTWRGAGARRRTEVPGSRAARGRLPALPMPGCAAIAVASSVATGSVSSIASMS
jgi:hypothetical protein